jgi:hypothetical protein
MTSYDVAFAFSRGRAQRLTARVRRIIALDATPNGYAGTSAYLVGRGELALIEPAPACDGLVETVLRETRGERIGHIFISGPPSLAAKKLAWLTGAQVHCLDLMDDGARVEGPGWTLEAVRAPWRRSRPAALALWEEHSLFCGDLVDGWSLRVGASDPGPLLASLDKVRRRDFDILWPASGPPILEVESWLGARVDALRQSERALPDHGVVQRAPVRSIYRRSTLPLSAAADQRNAA